MCQRNFQKYERVLLVVLSCCLVVLIAVALLLHITETQNTFVPTINAAIPTVEKNPDSIAVPGYELLELRADSKQQSLCLPNPEQNMCYFQISLYLEDGTLLWKSELIKPGKTSKPMTLIKILDKGTYPNAVLRYSCYRIDEDLSPLNGAETKVTLRVK